MGIVLLACVCGMVFAVFFSVLVSFHLCLASMLPFVSQVLGQLHGGRPRWINERQPPQRNAHHHPSQELHCTHTHHLSSGQKAQTGVPPTHGGGGGACQSAGGSRTSWSSVPWVCLALSSLHISQFSEGKFSILYIWKYPELSPLP